MRRFAELYDGNGVEACRKAGYPGDGATLATQAWRLLRNAEVKALIAAREEGSLAPLVLTREERQEFWSRMSADPNIEPALRLRSSELLAKSQGDFTQKIELKGELLLEHLVLGSMKKEE